MTLDSIGSLLANICVHWPVAKKHYLTDEGRVSKPVAQEWFRRIGFLEDEQADRMLEEYLADPDVNKYPPGVPYFLGKKVHKQTSYYKAPDYKDLRFKVERGDIIDHEGRIWADPDAPERKYYINRQGSICYIDNEREVVWKR